MTTTGSIVRDRQTPLREAYARRPDEAMTEKHARTSGSTADALHGTVEVGRGYGVLLPFGIDRAVGGLHDAPNPGDLLCAALAACADGTVRMVADLLGVRLDRLVVEVTGRVDVRGTLAMHPASRVGFDTMRCSVDLQPVAGTNPELIRRLLRASEQVCVNLDTLRRGTPVSLEIPR